MQSKREMRAVNTVGEEQIVSIVTKNNVLSCKRSYFECVVEDLKNFLKIL